MWTNHHFKNDFMLNRRLTVVKRQEGFKME